MKIKTKHTQIERSMSSNANRALHRSPLAHSILAGLVLCSVSVVTQAAEQQPYKDKPAFTLKIEPVDGSTMNQEAQVATAKPAKAEGNAVSHSTSRSIRLKDGGVIWVSKDPSSLTPVLNVSAPRSVEMEKGKFVSPMSFEITTNYAHFIDSWELEVFNAEDEQQKKPLATFMGRSLDTGRTVKWNGVSRKEYENRRRV